MGSIYHEESYALDYALYLLNPNQKAIWEMLEIATGYDINVDHSGNRVAAIAFWPDRVIIVVGKNKIVDTVGEAIKRVKNISCPLNAKRAGFNPPCVIVNK